VVHLKQVTEREQEKERETEMEREQARDRETERERETLLVYGVATISRILKITGLFCKNLFLLLPFCLGVRVVAICRVIRREKQR